MQYFDQSSAIARMNELGARRVPFIFVTNYRGDKTLIVPESEVDATQLRYAFNGVGNAPKAVRVQQPVIWEVTPPLYATYQRSFELVQRAIAAGETSLVNLTCKVAIRTNLSLETLFSHADARYRLWIKDTLVCFSPEIFIQIRDGEISSYPMKGTIPTSVPNAAQQLLDNPKEAAEHADVVALISADLAKVATHVHTTRYRYIDTLHTNKGDLLETSSEVRGTLPTDFHEHLGDIVFAQLPAGSITGYPKARTVDLIAEAETYQRDFYTGVMGRWDGHSLDTGVLIRFIDQADGQLYFKAGGGVTAQSTCEAEYNEVIAKVYVPIC
jgi:Anthranilate/para-aminobenzoate synthases component I